jgi:hypothetical protein
MRLFVLVVFVGCYSPTIHPGAPCGPGGACPGNLVCAADQTCEPAGAGDAAIADAPIDVPMVDACASCVAPANDLPAGAIDVSAGGNFTADLTYAHDDAQRPLAGGGGCGAQGGLDVYYKVTTAADQVYYFDTFNSDFDTVIRVIHGACTGGVAPTGTTCRNDSCGGKQSQLALTLTAGENCIVIDGNDGTQTGHTLHLHVEPGGRDGTHVTASNAFMGNTTGEPNLSQASCAMHDAPDHGFYLTACSGQTVNVTASTCNAVTLAADWDTALYATGPAGELACTDDDDAACAFSAALSTITFPAANAHLFWIVVDGAVDMGSGAYELDVMLQ